MIVVDLTVRNEGLEQGGPLSAPLYPEIKFNVKLSETNISQYIESYLNSEYARVQKELTDLGVDFNGPST